MCTQLFDKLAWVAEIDMKDSMMGYKLMWIKNASKKRKSYESKATQRSRQQPRDALLVLSLV
jgi:hypothetical protein